ncbi:formylglycine-generating enzyme family protein [Geodermatophilus sp. URMC 64]
MSPTQTESMVRVPGGAFAMGSDAHYADEAPVHRRDVDAFLLDVAPVTNREFRRFVEATGYVTDAERVPSAADYPGVPPALLVPGSAVFRRPSGGVDLDVPTWWEYVPGACWHAPEGPSSDIDDRLDHPVVQVSLHDAQAYSAWCGKRLPTEAEWERAAWAGTDAEFAWGDELRPGGRWMANTWPGPSFPEVADPDREPGTSAVGSFPPNAWGLLDLIGNVWEWTTDRYEPGHSVAGACCGAPRPAVVDPLHLGPPLMVLKGGSFLCAENYCRRYRPAARIPQAADSSASNVGFRCAADPDPQEDLP